MARIERARGLDETPRPEFWAVLHENTLRTHVGGPATMAAQLAHIASVVRERKAMVTVLPHTAGEHAAMGGMQSSYSDHNGGSCIEVLDNLPGVVPVRDSKNPHGPALVIPATGWTEFVAAIKSGAIQGS